ncbi:Uncharacterised protein [Vibrio cholerae]|nr:Uncharacterised protein [Vibrio cholerae]
MCHFWIDDFDTRAEFNTLLSSNTLDLFWVTQKYTLCNTAFSTDSSCFHSTWLITFWQYDTLVRATSQFSQLVTEGWWAQATRRLRTFSQRVYPWAVNVACHVFADEFDTLFVIGWNFKAEAL